MIAALTLLGWAPSPYWKYVLELVGTRYFIDDDVDDLRLAHYTDAPKRPESVSWVGTSTTQIWAFYRKVQILSERGLLP
jgi:hypothetical protein